MDGFPGGDPGAPVPVAPRAGWPELERSDVPGSALSISLLALAVAGGTNLAWPRALTEYASLIWLLALIPPFLLAYYRGWRGVTLALSAGMLLLLAVEVGGSLWADRAVRWWVLGIVTAALITVSLGAGLISDRLHRRTTDALRLAYRDPLTGLPNRRVLELFLERHYAAALRGHPLSVVVFDIDDFKGYNDRRGHAAGDDAIRAVARALNGNTRAEDLSGRLGGDEFLALLPGEEVEGARRFAERVRRGVEPIAGSEGPQVTVSAGVAGFRPGVAGSDELVRRADSALYVAKSLGGDRVVLEGKESTIESATGERGEPAPLPGVPAAGDRPGPTEVRQ